MSAYTRMVVIKDVAGGAFVGVLQGAERLVAENKTNRVQHARFCIDNAHKTLPGTSANGLVQYSSFELALAAIPHIAAWYSSSDWFVDIDDPLVLEWDGKDVRKMRPTGYA